MKTKAEQEADTITIEVRKITPCTDGKIEVSLCRQEQTRINATAIFKTFEPLIITPASISVLESVVDAMQDSARLRYLELAAPLIAAERAIQERETARLQSRLAAMLANGELYARNEKGQFEKVV